MRVQRAEFHPTRQRSYGRCRHAVCCHVYRVRLVCFTNGKKSRSWILGTLFVCCDMYYAWMPTRPRCDLAIRNSDAGGWSVCLKYEVLSRYDRWPLRRGRPSDCNISSRVQTGNSLQSWRNLKIKKKHFEVGGSDNIEVLYFFSNSEDRMNPTTFS